MFMQSSQTYTLSCQQLTHVYYNISTLNPTFMFSYFREVWNKLVILGALIWDAIDGRPAI